MFWKSKTRVILDTNFLLLLGQGVDIFTKLKECLDEPYVLCVVSATKEELDQIREKPGKHKFSAKLARIMIEQQGLKTLTHSKNKGYADAMILDLLKKDDIVATLDKALQKQVLANEGRIVTLGSKKLVLKKGSTA